MTWLCGDCGVRYPDAQAVCTNCQAQDYADLVKAARTLVAECERRFPIGQSLELPGVRLWDAWNVVATIVGRSADASAASQPEGESCVT